MAGRPSKKILGKKFRTDVREALYLTQIEVAKRLGIREKRYQKIEASEVIGVDPGRIPMMAAIAKMTTDEFLAKFGAPDGRQAKPAPPVASPSRGNLAQRLIEFAGMSDAERAAVAMQVPVGAARAIVETFQSRIRGRRKKPAA